MTPHSASAELRAATPRRALVALVVIICLAGAIRWAGLNKGLPYAYYPDEPGYIYIAQKMFKTGDWNPRFYNYPAVFFYANALAYYPYYAVARLAGAIESPDGIVAPEMILVGVGKTALPSTFLLGRGLMWLFRVATIVLIFGVGRDLGGDWRTGLAAAGLLALSPTHAEYSRYMFPHVLFTFALLLAFWACWRVCQRGTPQDYVLAGLGCGLATATMYHGAVSLLALAAAHFLREGWAGVRSRSLAGAGLLAIAVFVVLNPAVVVDPGAFLQGAGFIVAHYLTAVGGRDNAGMGGAPGYYLSFSWQVEGPLTVLAGLEFLRSAFTRHRARWLLAGMAMAYFVLISSAIARNPRTFLPLIPFLVLGAALWLTALPRRLPARRWIGLLLWLAAVPPPAWKTVADVRFQLGPDSRETARRWVEAQAPPGARIALEAYAPYVDPTRYTIAKFSRLIDNPPEWYVANEIDYLVFSQGMYRRYLDEPATYPDEVARYHQLFTEFGDGVIFTDGGYEVRVYPVPARP